MCKKVIVNGKTIYVTHLKGKDDNHDYGGGKQAYHVVVAGGNGSTYHTGDRTSSEAFIKDAIAKEHI